MSPMDARFADVGTPVSFAALWFATLTGDWQETVNWSLISA